MLALDPQILLDHGGKRLWLHSGSNLTDPWQVVNWKGIPAEIWNKSRFSRSRLFLNHTEGSPGAFFDADAASFAVVVVDLSLHRLTIEMDRQIRAEFIAIEAE